MIPHVDDAAFMVLAGVTVLLLIERMVELRIDRTHRAALERDGARVHDGDGFRAILAVQILLFVAPFVELGYGTARGLGPWTFMALVLLVAAQAIRYWVIQTLGQRWTMRVVTVPDSPRIVAGPYRYLRHPNYVAVNLEYVALPLVIGAFWASAGLLALGLGTTWYRIRAEEAALSADTASISAPGTTH